VLCIQKKICKTNTEDPCIPARTGGGCADEKGGRIARLHCAIWYT